MKREAGSGEKAEVEECIEVAIVASLSVFQHVGINSHFTSAHITQHRVGNIHTQTD